ncbi:PAP2 superfamily protein [Hirsutella rhossiliensis]|uniref:PAP2 superfamily domain-containing protein n=1 Tax=Hirsutella rhossiliensis TaxID=111463 RepID=A0A9P8N462_9HYPO|nr:PAP2 superfamily domain-containing protein [Hirsutella rhossiliensis]KAH0968063.1 PAP2 superfamily domain-containing protein [Hirsutella rhossiliensis]
MAVGAFAEPLVVVVLLFGGAWVNRNKDYDLCVSAYVADKTHKRSDELLGGGDSNRRDSRESQASWSGSSTPTLAPHEVPTLRRRRIRFFGRERFVTTPNTLVFQDRFLSRVLEKFPFLAEAWYWALVYWIYQLGRAFTALSLVEGTVHVARQHALQLIHLEQRLNIFYEVPVQRWFLARPDLMHWINRVYSFIHIPGTIFFLVALYYLTTTGTRRAGADKVAAGPGLYEARRRTMAMCNLVAFVVFTLWPCMPPRLLSDPDYQGDDAAEAKSYGFVDTVHGKDGESSVWTTNRFCNQYAAMPSLHFGYSLLIGLTVATLPISGLRATSWKRMGIVMLGMSYPALILTAIVATANHFILDAVAGAVVCGIAWHSNGLLLNLCVVEDYFLWLVRIHRPVNHADPDTAVEPGLHAGLLLHESV